MHAVFLLVVLPILAVSCATSPGGGGDSGDGGAALDAPPEVAMEASPSDAGGETPPEASADDAASSPPVQVGVGRAHACAIAANGTVRCWGDNEIGQLGNGTRIEQLRPTLVPGLSDVVQLSVSGSVNCVRLSDATIRCWGHGFGTEDCGRGRKCSTTPVVVPVPDSAPVAQVITSGLHHCVVLVGGAVRCWGSNYYGELGDGTRLERVTPTLVPKLVDAAEVALGARFSCVARRSGNVSCWGSGLSQQLGFDPPDTCDFTLDGITSVVPCSLTPGEVVGLRDAVQVGAGVGRTCALLKDGFVNCWGSSWSVPPRRYDLGARRISLDSRHACALVKDGSVTCWGIGYDGDGGSRNTDRAPYRVPGIKEARDVAVGGSAVCVIANGGTVWCWGYNVGDGTSTIRRSPVRVAW